MRATVSIGLLMLACTLGASGCGGSGASGTSTGSVSAAASPSPSPSSVVTPGGAPTIADGTLQHPFEIPVDPQLPDYRDARDTRQAPSDVLDRYPGHAQDESGPEFFYRLRCTQRTVVRARIGAEPAGTDVDLHLVSSVAPTVVIARGDVAVNATLDPGEYFLVLDTYVAGGVAKPGPYDLVVELEASRAGTVADPLLLGDATQPLALPFAFTDARDTRLATSRAFDTYPGHAIDERGPEFIYRFTLAEPARLAATIAFDEPTGTDVDLHLLSGATPSALIDRGDTSIYALLQPGTHWLILDTSAAGATEQAGPYELHVSVRSRNPAPSPRFNDFILAAVDQLNAEHRLQGYGAAALTHDIAYGNSGTVRATGGGKTMCVAAVMEVMLTAMTIWAEDRGDPSVFSYLPVESWQTLRSSHIKAHLWVNASLGAHGSADALRNFDMGERVPFEQLRPGGFINLNRTNRTGHAVVFLAFVDAQGREHEAWNPAVIGFKYFSAQGGSAVGAGGLDFRYAIFSSHGAPAMPYRRDLNVIYSTNQRLLNTGEMWSPTRWGTP